MNNMMTLLLVLMFMFIGGCSMPDKNSMTQDEMERIVIDNVELIEQKKGYVVFEYKKVKMVLISDVKHDRMRIIAPITDYSELTAEQKDVIMESNFHRALDARYAVSNGVLYSAFIHPMSLLIQKELEDALNQVSTLALTFGSSYSSGELSFGGELQIHEKANTHGLPKAEML